MARKVNWSDPNGSKACPRCKVEFSLSEFIPDGGGKQKRSECKSCASDRAKEWRAKNPDKSKNSISRYHKNNRAAILIRMRENSLRRNYGIGIDEHASMLSAQSGKCANKMCPNIAVGSGRSLVVDHSHSSGLVRGLLCYNCNLALGNVNDNIEALLGLVDYLNMHDGTEHGGWVHEIYAETN